jgi:hypothetical protein
MSEPGSRSKQTSTFMLPEDEAAFGKVVAPAIHGLAQWETHDHKARTITLHDSLPDAMDHNPTQAFLRLLGRDGGTVGPHIQYLRTIVVTSDDAVLATTGGRFRATAERPEEMSPGRLAFKWFPKTRRTACSGTSPFWPVWLGKPCGRWRRRTSRLPSASWPGATASDRLLRYGH